jgi:two-component system sensor histidine kinase VanS
LGEIPKEKLDVIFEKFCRLDASRATQTGGAGLGLAIAKDIVALHGGVIKAESGDGRTVFTVTLPNAPVKTVKTASL